ncbi:MAG: hypothetical protein WC712_08720 [Candidatus Brocadiia bacterium]
MNEFLRLDSRGGIIGSFTLKARNRPGHATVYNRSMPLRLAVLVLALAVASSGLCWAEKVQFTDGTNCDGELTCDGTQLSLRSGDKILKFDKLKVTGITDRADTYTEYRRRYDACPQRSVENLSALARWCEEHFLIPEAREIYDRILTLEPDNYAARTLLGYVRDRESWRRFPEAEYRDREARLRVGDVKGYEDLATWCAASGVSGGLKDCSFYILRLDAFHVNALKWARPFLEQEKISLPAAPLDEFTVASLGPVGAASAFELFSVRLAGVDGSSLLGRPVTSPVAGRVEYASAQWPDLPDGEKEASARENFVLIRVGSRLVYIGGFALDGFAATTGADVTPGAALGRVGRPMGGAPGVILRVLDEDRFSTPVFLAHCYIGSRDGYVEANDHPLAAGETIRNSKP